MPIDTEFTFQHAHPPGEAGLEAVPVDPLGLLRGLVETTLPVSRSGLGAAPVSI
jgi:hypothetical protein